MWKYQQGTTGLPSGVNPHGNAHKLLLNPNPASTNSTIQFVAGFNTYAILEVFDSNKNTIVKLHQGKINAGLHEFSFDCTTLPAGIYHVILRTNEHFLTEKLVVIKQ